MNYGLVIGTCGCVPYIHLWLESRKRYFPHVPTLVHEDFSPETEALRTLCKEYGVLFQATDTNLGHWNGDMSAFVAGFDWAKESQFTHLVKMSRRFIPVHDWTRHMNFVQERPTFAIFSNTADDSGLPIRTECIAINREIWEKHGCVQIMKNILAERRAIMCVEVEMGILAKKVHTGQNGGTFSSLIKSNVPRHFKVWPLLPKGRRTKIHGVLWHPNTPPESYAKAASNMGLSYTAQDFEAGKFH